MDTGKKCKPVIGIGLTVGILVLGLLFGLSGEMNPAKGMRLNAGAPPNAKPDTYKYTSNETKTVLAPGVLANDKDPDTGDTVTAVAASGNTNPAGSGTYSLAIDGSFTYTPGSYSGDATFIYYAIDSSTPRLQSLATTVTLLTNFPPTAFKDTYYYTTGTGAIIGTTNVLANDTDPEPGTLTVFNPTPPLSITGNTTEGGTFTLNENGSFTYTPPTNTFTGEDSFTYRAKDVGGKISGYAIVTLRNSQFLNTPPPTGEGTGTCMFADCLITGATGNWCTANNMEILGIEIDDVTDLCGPPICNPITNICQPDTGMYDFRVRMNPTAKNIYGVGIWIEVENVPGVPISYTGAMEGNNCYKSYLYPLETTDLPFNGSSGVGPFRNLNSDICGDANKTDGITLRILKDVKVVCTDELMAGYISALATWAGSSDRCTGTAYRGVCPNSSAFCYKTVTSIEVSNKPVDLKLTKTSSISNFPWNPTTTTTPPTPILPTPFPTDYPYPDGKTFEYTIKVENDPDDRGCYRSSGYVIEDILPNYLRPLSLVSAKSYTSGVGTDIETANRSFTCVDTNGTPLPGGCTFGSILQIKVLRDLPTLATAQPIGDLLPLATCDNQWHEFKFLVEYNDPPSGGAPRNIINEACVNGFQYDPWGGAYEYVDPVSGEVVIIDTSGNNCDDDKILTAVDLTYFQATPQEGSILLEWETGSEKDNLGFNLYRATSLAGDNKVQLNAGLIPSNSPGGMQGSSYSFLDTYYLDPNATYYYWLEDVDFYGVKTLHGPTVAKVITAEPNWFYKIFLPFMDKR